MEMPSVCVPPLNSSIPYTANQSTLNPMSNLAKNLAAAQGEFPVIPRAKTARIKTKAGGEFSYAYADLADILKVILPILSKHGLSLSQPIVREGDKSYLRTIIRHESGESISDFGIPLNESLNHQEYGGQLTYWRRYGLSSMLGISTDEDNDVTPIQKKEPKKKATEDAPTPEQYEEYGKRVRNYGQDVKLLGRWMKKYVGVEDIKQFTNKQWESVFNALDDAQKTGTLPQLIGAYENV